MFKCSVGPNHAASDSPTAKAKTPISNKLHFSPTPQDFLSNQTYPVSGGKESLYSIAVTVAAPVVLADCDNM